jgi:hypothetical protein
VQIYSTAACLTILWAASDLFHLLFLALHSQSRGHRKRGGKSVESANHVARKPLLEVHRLATPAWAKVDEEIAATGFWRSVRTVPAVTSLVTRLAWRTSRLLTLLATLVHVAAGCVTAFGLFATADVFTTLLRDGPTPQRLLASLPMIAAVVGLYALKALLDTTVAAVEGALRPLVTCAAEEQVTETVVRTTLLAAEDADGRRCSLPRTPTSRSWSGGRERTASSRSRTACGRLPVSRPH